MMNGSHSSWTDLLSDYMDGDLPAAEQVAVEEHLAGCAACRELLEELRAVVDGAHALGETQPERDLWPGIAEGIGAPAAAPAWADVIALPTAARTRPRRTGLFLTVPQLAAASVALALVSAAATLWVGPGLATARQGAKKGEAPVAAAPTDAATIFPAADLAGPPPELAPELQRLEAVLSAARGQLEPNTVRILEKNLGVIERAIDESRRALALDPNNRFLREHLERTWQEKLDYLREAVGIADWTG